MKLDAVLRAPTFQLLLLKALAAEANVTVFRWRVVAVRPAAVVWAGVPGPWAVEPVPVTSNAVRIWALAAAVAATRARQVKAVFFSIGRLSRISVR